VPNLIAKSPLAGQAPVTLLDTTLSEAVLGPIISIAPFPGAEAAVAQALGQAFPSPNTHTNGLCWTGAGQAFLIGRDAPNLSGLAATTDQSSGWAALRLTGPMAADALMRHVPLNLVRMQPGQAARAPLGHMNMILMRDDQGFLILVFRSMARTAWHEVEAAMTMLAARMAL
jgi:heterotetrameric sarcosine oxidase gamma subunit